MLGRNGGAEEKPTILSDCAGVGDFRSSCQSAAAQHSSPGWARFTCWSGEHVLLSSPHTWNTFSHLTTNVFLVLTQLSRVDLAGPTDPVGGSALPSSVPGIELTR